MVQRSRLEVHDLIEEIDAVTEFDPRLRPWYTAATERQGISFSPIFTGFQTGELVVTASLPVYDQGDRLVGVLGTDLLLAQLSRFLRSIDLGGGGALYIVERTTGILVANSELTDNFRRDDSGALLRVRPAESGHEVIADTWSTVRAEQQRATPGTSPPPRRTRGLLVGVLPYRNLNLDWLIVVAVPEHPFLVRIVAATRTAAGIIFAVMAVRAVLGTLAVRRVLAPLEGLVKNAATA